jgi:hypothetical protein
MEDIRIGRASRSVLLPIAVGPAATPLIGPDNNRVSIRFSTHPSFGAVSQCTFSTDANVAVDAGLNTSGYNHDVYLHIDTDGDIVTKAWYGISAAGTIIGGMLVNTLPLV